MFTGPLATHLISPDMSHATVRGPNMTNFIGEIYFHNMKIRIISFAETLW